MHTKPMNLLTSLRRYISTLQVLWNYWNLRGFVLASFTLQLVLICFAPYRKRTSNGLIILPIWLSYLLADWVAAQAIGLILKPTPGSNSSDIDLLAFWAQFLLLHLGGPDTITALAIEDNELWFRTALHLGVQVYATCGVIFRSIEQSKLWAPTILMFFAGIIKYLERVLSLMHGRLTNFDKGPSYHENLIQGYKPRLACSRTYPECKPSPENKLKDVDKLKDVEMVRDAFYYFHYFKGVYADRIFTPKEVQYSSSYFFYLMPEEAFTVIEIELNFAYEFIFTKMVIIHNKVGKVLRAMVMLLQVGCLVIWCLITKTEYHGYDIVTTYILLIGAIAVDVVALFRILFSDWFVAHRIKEYSTIGSWLLLARKRTWGRYRRKEEAPMGAWLRRAFFRRWSESVSQFNLINLCAGKKRQSSKMQKLIEVFGLKEKLDKNKYVTNEWFSDYLREIIFKEMISKLESEEVYKFSISEADWQSRCKSYLESKGCSLQHLDWDVSFQKSLVVWHIATDLCYESEIQVTTRVEDKKPENCFKWTFGCIESLFQGKTADKDEEKDRYREFCKVVSEYMLYLLIWQPSLVPSFASKTSYQDICSQVEGTLQDYKPQKDKTATCSCILNSLQIEGSQGPEALATERMNYKAKAKMIATELKNLDNWNRPKWEDLYKAAKLAIEMQKMEDKWEIMAGIWVEALCYAAKHSAASVHAAQLKQGGELLTVVWLLMVQLGVGRRV